MIKNTVIPILITLATTGATFSQNHKVRCTETAGCTLLEEEGTIKNRNKEGSWKDYYGCKFGHRLREEGNYENDRKTGLWKEYFDNGTLKAVGEMNGRLRLGKWNTYYSNGQLSGSGEYKDDGYPLENSWITYDRNGQLDKVNSPEPTTDQILGLFLDIERQKIYEGALNFNYVYQETLWKLAGANPNEFLSSPVKKWEELKEIEGFQKVTRFWNKYKEILVAEGSPTNIGSGRNILKYSIDGGFLVFIYDGIRTYHFDLNFVDPSDGKTVLDFLQEGLQLVKTSPPIAEGKLKEYQRYYEMLKAYGVQHAVEFK